MANAKLLPAMLLVVAFVVGACAGEPNPDTIKMTKGQLDKTTPAYSVLDQRGP